jgi:hypothetical protein
MAVHCTAAVPSKTTTSAWLGLVLLGRSISCCCQQAVQAQSGPSDTYGISDIQRTELYAWRFATLCLWTVMALVTICEVKHAGLAWQCQYATFTESALHRTGSVVFGAWLTAVMAVSMTKVD